MITFSLVLDNVGLLPFITSGHLSVHHRYRQDVVRPLHSTVVLSYLMLCYQLHSLTNLANRYNNNQHQPEAALVASAHLNMLEDYLKEVDKKDTRVAMSVGQAKARLMSDHDCIHHLSNTQANRQRPSSMGREISRG